MSFIEDDASILAPTYSRPLRYVYDSDLPGKSKFRYVFDEGGLRCSEAAEQGEQVCIVSSSEMTAIGSDRPSFVYVDDGCWVDNADGNGTRRRDFVIVCGPHVYLCEMMNSTVAPESKVPSVNQLFVNLAAAGCPVRVLGYLRARDIAPQTATDTNLYLFLGDLHLPPVTWFYTQMAAGLVSPPLTPPLWLIELPAFRRRANLLANYYTISEHARRSNSVPAPLTGLGFGNADIFGHAGTDLVRFLSAIAGLPSSLKQRLHFIQTGDMFELWLGRSYLYSPGFIDPSWASADAPHQVADWALEVIIQNLQVFESFRALSNAGLREVSYLWGNHDAYLKDAKVCAEVGLPSRISHYTGLNNDIFSEHGHRFDRSNWDNTGFWWSGPMGAQAAFYIPVARSLEKPVRVLTGLGHPSDDRDCIVLGAALIYLYEKYDLRQGPFAVYVMGHTHDRKHFRYNVRADFHLCEGSG